MSSERAAEQVDQAVERLTRAARPLNPIRVVGRVAAGTVATAFGVSGVVVSRTGKLLQIGTRRAAGKP